MDWILIGKAALLGLLEGATEFLPVSSTGHLIIAGDLLNFKGEESKTFKIFIQLGAILAILVYYRERVRNVVVGARHDPQSQRFLRNLAIAFLPAAVFGLLFHKFIKTYLFNSITVASALILGGIVILWLESRPRTVRIHTVDDLRWQDALKIGLAQSAALFPGVSRAGATIMGGLFFGLSRKAATEFSFFLAIPTMIVATIYDLYKSHTLFSADQWVLLAVGFICAFVSAFVVVKTFLDYVSRHDFRLFAYYRIVFGTIVLIVGATGIVDFSASDA